MSFSEAVTLIRTVMSDRKGLTMVEYGIAGVAIALAALATVKTVGTNLSATMTSISNAL